jgi:AcrR family transcriptional regulator
MSKDEPHGSRPGPPPTKHRDILLVAAQLFAARGVAQTSTRDIAAAAKTTERTLFKHYGSKDGLVRAVIDQAVIAQLAPTSLDHLRRLIEAHNGDMQAWHIALLAQRADALSKSPELARLLLVELLRDDVLRGRFAEQWQAAAWRPLVELFKRLQRDQKIATDIGAETLARAFLSINLGYLISRFVLAPDLKWNDPREQVALAKIFAQGTSR